MPLCQQNLKVDYRPVSALIPYAKNARTHSEAQIAEIAASIGAFGWTNPILVDGDNGIIAGHGRVLAARKLGLSTVPVIELAGMSEAEKRAYVIADNKLALNAGWDLELLSLELGALQEAGFDLSLTGFTGDELHGLLNTSSGLTDPDDVPEIAAEPVSRTGDLWVLGHHRLLCGDSTRSEDVARCLNGVSPHLMVTDPPYGVNYDPSWRKKLADDPEGLATGTVMNDDRADWREAWALFPGDVAYVWHASLQTPSVADSLEAAGFDLRSQIIWDKTRLVIGRGDYHWRHEPCQPPGTMVDVAGGSSVPIESLKDGDRVVSYSPYESTIRPRGRPVLVASRHYSGALYRVSVGNRVTRATDGHQFTIRFNSGASAKHVVYLMRRGNYWRVGHTGLYNSRGFGLTVRMSKERGEAAWILAVTDTRMDASVLEQIIHCRYGVPTTHWEPCEGFDPDLHRSADHIRRIYSEIGLERIALGAARLLRDYGRSPDYPFVVAGEDGAFSRVKTRTVRAVNLIPDLMQVPVPTGGSGFEWRTIDSIQTEPYEGIVYSMSVDKDQHYIADGIVTHNCWYAVRRGKTGHWSGDRKQTTIWQIPHLKSETGHGTQKPVECMKRPIENNSSPGHAVYDPFCGSGTTIIAAEMTGRICHAIDLDPAYVDVAVRRWQAFTGREAVLDGDGRSFNAIAASRGMSVSSDAGASSSEDSFSVAELA